MEVLGSFLFQTEGFHEPWEENRLMHLHKPVRKSKFHYDLCYLTRLFGKELANILVSKHLDLLKG